MISFFFTSDITGDTYGLKMMSDRLAEMMNVVVDSEGTKGKARLSGVANRSVQMIDRYRKKECTPPFKVARDIAIECGASEEDALQLALECSSEAKTA